MKKAIKTVALLALIGLSAAGCQKENIVEPLRSSESVTTYTVYYTVDGESSKVILIGESAWQRFLDRIFALAEEGHSVSFHVGGHERGVAKETVTYKTSDYEDAQKWVTHMSEQGYEVSISFDEGTGIYTCIAIK